MDLGSSPLWISAGMFDQLVNGTVLSPSPSLSLSLVLVHIICSMIDPSSISWQHWPLFFSYSIFYCLTCLCLWNIFFVCFFFLLSSEQCVSFIRCYCLRERCKGTERSRNWSPCRSLPFIYSIIIIIFVENLVFLVSISFLTVSLPFLFFFLCISPWSFVYLSESSADVDFFSHFLLLLLLLRL